MACCPFSCAAAALLAIEASTAADTKLPYPFFLFDGEVVGVVGNEADAFVGVDSSIEPCREELPVPLRGLLHGAGDPPPTSGLGRGVRSVIAARYGDGNAEFAEPGEREVEAILAVERLERREEPMVGCMNTGEVNDCCKDAD